MILYSDSGEPFKYTVDLCHMSEALSLNGEANVEVW